MMSAVLKGDAPRFAAMRENDLDAVISIEWSVYSHPWTRGNFSDSLHAGYVCRTLRTARALVGYFILQAALDEAHLLNLSVAASYQRHGHGSTLLREVMRLAVERGATRVYLEVRPSNLAAQALYAGFGFSRVGLRKGYYPARTGREDAIVLACDL